MPIGLIIAGLLAAILGVLIGGEAGWWIVLAGVIAVIAGVEHAWRERRGSE